MLQYEKVISFVASFLHEYPLVTEFLQKSSILGFSFMIFSNHLNIEIYIIQKSEQLIKCDGRTGSNTVARKLSW